MQGRTPPQATASIYTLRPSVDGVRCKPGRKRLPLQLQPGSRARRATDSRRGTAVHARTRRSGRRPCTLRLSLIGDRPSRTQTRALPQQGRKSAKRVTRREAAKACKANLPKGKGGRRQVRPTRPKPSIPPPGRSSRVGLLLNVRRGACSELAGWVAAHALAWDSTTGRVRRQRAGRAARWRARARRPCLDRDKAGTNGERLARGAGTFTQEERTA
jgi:hypothetical protein